jgi:hydrogenase maturation protease
VIGIRDSGFGIRDVSQHVEPPPSRLEARTTRHDILVLCLGNDVLRDDGVAWAVADELERSLVESPTSNPESRAPSPEPRVPPFDSAQGSPEALEGPNPESRVVVKRSALSGFYLLDELSGWERVLIVDAVQTGGHAPGTVLSFPFEALGTEAGPSPHAVGLPTVIRLGRQSGVPLPSWIHIVAIEAEDMASFVEGLTPAVEAAVPQAVAVIRSVLAHAPAHASAPAPARPGQAQPPRASNLP